MRLRSRSLRSRRRRLRLLPSATCGAFSVKRLIKILVTATLLWHVLLLFVVLRIFMERVWFFPFLWGFSSSIQGIVSYVLPGGYAMRPGNCGCLGGCSCSFLIELICIFHAGVAHWVCSAVALCLHCPRCRQWVKTEKGFRGRAENQAEKAGNVCFSLN